MFLTQPLFRTSQLTNDRSTTQVFYSAGTAPLAQATEALPNDVSGQGQYHFGMLKKPVGGGSDITKSGFQPSNIDEGIIYGGILLEDSASGTITKSLSSNATAKATGKAARRVERGQIGASA